MIKCLFHGGREVKNMEDVEKLFEIISNFNSPWQVLEFGIVVVFLFGCLWLLYKFWSNLF